MVLEARLRIGGRTVASAPEDHRLETYDTWIHWSQPHIRDDMTRAGLSIIENQTGSPEKLSWCSGGNILTRKMNSVLPLRADAMSKYCDVDGLGDQPSVVAIRCRQRRTSN